MRIKRKLKWDDSGASSSGFQLVILIVIGLLVWEFGAGYLGINSISSYLGVSEETPSVPSATITYINSLETFQASDELIDVDDNPRNEHEDLDVYPCAKEGWTLPINHNWDVANWRVEILTNLPTKVLFPYTIEVRLERVSQTHQLSTKVIYSESISPENFEDGEKTIIVNFENEDFWLSDTTAIWHEYTAVYTTIRTGFGSVFLEYNVAFFEADAVLYLQA